MKSLQWDNCLIFIMLIPAAAYLEPAPVSRAQVSGRAEFST